VEMRSSAEVLAGRLKREAPLLANSTAVAAETASAAML